MRTGKRILTCMICVLFVLTLLVSSVCIVRASGHACCGYRCLVCNLIAQVGKLLHGLTLLLTAALTMAALHIAHAVWEVEQRQDRAYCTLVRWKIRLND